jgi:hypothetical protein
LCSCFVLESRTDIKHFDGETRGRLERDFFGVVTLEDGETILDAFLDRNFREEEQ